MVGELDRKIRSFLWICRDDVPYELSIIGLVTGLLAIGQDLLCLTSCR